jgi:ArsR family transcriptional regulator
MDVDHAASILAQLGNSARLQVLRLLIQAGRDGLPVGQIQAHLGMAPSTLAFHLRGLVSVGLVAQERQGRVVVCRPCFERLDEVTGFLREQCCTGLPASAGRDSRSA